MNEVAFRLMEYKSKKGGKKEKNPDEGIRQSKLKKKESLLRKKEGGNNHPQGKR